MILDGTSQQQPTPIDEKAELESQYEEDFEKPKSKKSLIANQKPKGPNKRSNAVVTAAESVNTSMIQETLLPVVKVRDNSQGSIDLNQGPAVYRTKEETKPSKKSMQQLSHSPSDSSLEKAAENNTRSLQPSQLGNKASISTVIIKPIQTNPSLVTPSQP